MDEPREIQFTAAGRCDIGKVRSLNEDQVYVSTQSVGILPNLFIVADGMGGHRAGDLAASEAVQYFREYIEDHCLESDNVTELMKTALQMTNRYIYYLAKESPDYEGMGTTFVAASIVGSKLTCVNVGDSRLYKLIRAGDSPQTLERVTEDHSVVEQLVKEGSITEEEARVHPLKNMITRAIGIDEEVEIDDFSFSLSDVSRILMCSDGLSNMLPDLSILQELSAGKDPQQTADEFIDLANEAGGKDNISVIVISIDRPSNGEGAANA